MRTGPLRKPKRRYITCGGRGSTASPIVIDDSTVLQYVIELECGHTLYLHIASYDMTGANGRKVKCSECRGIAFYDALLDQSIDDSMA